MQVAIEDLRTQVLSGVRKLGYEGTDAQIISDVLLYAEMRGNNQGITKIATGGVPKAEDVEPYRVVSLNKCGALVSGGHAMVATHNAAKLACEIASEHGVGIVGSNKTFSSSGAVGYFARQIAESGYIGLVCVGTKPFVAPFGSWQPKLGTNPMCYAFPTDGEPVIFDTATAAMAFFGVVEASLKGEPLPPGIAFDENGNPTTSAAEALKGSVVTFAEHKGFGLSLFVQLLAGPFVGASFGGLHAEGGSGTIVIAIDPGLVVDRDSYFARSSELVDAVRSAKPLDGNRVILPGERGDDHAARAQSAGSIEIADSIWLELSRFVEQN